MATLPVLIVGAGPAGLAVAGRLRTRDADFQIVEAAPRVANAWHEHYERLHLHTVKELSHLPGLPFRDDDVRYVPRARLVDYFTEYARHFDLRPRFGVEVTRVERGDAGWRVETASGENLEARHVVVATGVNRVPHRPSLPNESEFQGRVLHSRLYRSARPFRDARALVVGMGNTGAEIALDLAEAGIAVGISIRGPINIVPRDVLGRPTQRTAMQLSRLPAPVADRLGSWLRRWTVGNLEPYGIPTPSIPPIRQLRELGKTPVIDVGTVAAIRDGRIAVHPAIEHLLPDSIRFENGDAQPYDTVILATGYRSGLPELIPGVDTMLDRNGVPACVSGTGPFHGLHFCGFDNYQPGGILSTIRTESATIADAVTGAA